MERTQQMSGQLVNKLIKNLGGRIEEGESGDYGSQELRK